MAQINVWNGSAHVKPKAIKVWNGSAWEDKIGKYWNGSTWVDFISYEEIYWQAGMTNHFSAYTTGNPYCVVDTNNLIVYARGYLSSNERDVEDTTTYYAFINFANYKKITIYANIHVNYASNYAKVLLAGAVKYNAPVGSARDVVIEIDTSSITNTQQLVLEAHGVTEGQYGRISVSKITLTPN